MPPLARDLVEATTWEPLGDVTEEGKEVDREETGREEDVELVGCLVGNANQWVVLCLGSVSMRYPEDKDANRPIVTPINQSAAKRLLLLERRTYLRTGPTKFSGSSNMRRSISEDSSSKVSRNFSTLARVPMTP